MSLIPMNQEKNAPEETSASTAFASAAAAAASNATAGAGSASASPAQRGFHMPAEWQPQRRCWMAWPGHAPSYHGRFEQARAAHARVAATIARYEPVVMLAPPADCAAARALCGPAVEVRPLMVDDGWFRDSGPTFVVDGLGGKLGVDWDFNGWGGRTPCANDRLAARAVLAQEGIERVAAPLVMEGGSFHVDGEGTLITTEECLLNPNRNPQLARAQIETQLREHLGVREIVWLKGGPVDDVTDGHVDMVAAFVRPGVVVALSCDDPHDANYAVLQANLEILRGCRDARGRRLEVIELPQPPAARLPDGTRMGLSHINYLLCNDALILPAYGEARHDAQALGLLRELHPEREVLAVDTRDLLYGGGNIHCITQQEPRAASDV
jgi:agmatine deiminase